MICKHDNAVCICGKGENDYCPIKPLTNEEWRRTCSTEDFASWLMKHFSRDDIIVLWAKHNYPTRETADGLKCADYKEAIRRWLKEKHE